MVKKPSKYDNAVFPGPKIVDPKTIYDELVSGAANEAGWQELVNEIASEVREWLKIDKTERSRAATNTGEFLLLKCESILRTDFGPVGPSGMRTGPPPDREKAAVLLGYMHCQWRVQAYGFERLAGIGRGADGNLLRTKGEPVTEKAKVLYDAGKTIREVAKSCGVTKSVAERWRKEHFQKT